MYYQNYVIKQQNVQIKKIHQVQLERSSFWQSFWLFPANFGSEKVRQRLFVDHFMNLFFDKFYNIFIRQGMVH